MKNATIVCWSSKLIVYDQDVLVEEQELMYLVGNTSQALPLELKPPKAIFYGEPICFLGFHTLEDIVKAVKENFHLFSAPKFSISLIYSKKKEIYFSKLLW